MYSKYFFFTPKIVSANPEICFCHIIFYDQICLKFIEHRHIEHLLVVLILFTNIESVKKIFCLPCISYVVKLLSHNL